MHVWPLVVYKSIFPPINGNGNPRHDVSDLLLPVWRYACSGISVTKTFPQSLIEYCMALSEPSFDNPHALPPLAILFAFVFIHHNGYHHFLSSFSSLAFFFFFVMIIFTFVVLHHLATVFCSSLSFLCAPFHFSF